MKPVHAIIIISVCVLILIGLGLWYYLDRPPTPAALTQKALSGRSLPERQRAVAQLIMVKGVDIRPFLRRLIAESQDPEILGTAINGMTPYRDLESMPLFIDDLNHSAGSVREAAYDAIVKYFGGEKLPEGIDYDWNDPPETREKVIGRLKDVLAEQKKEQEKVALEKQKQDQKK